MIQEFVERFEANKESFALHLVQGLKKIGDDEV